MSTINWKKIKDLNGTQVKKMLKMLEPRSLKYSPHIPTPKQQVFMNLNIKEAFYGGAAAGGKSDALLMDALQFVDIKGYAAIIFRKSFADLTKPGALIDRAKEWLLTFSNVRWKEKDRKFEFIEKYGKHTDIKSILQFGYLENESDKYNYQGGEYQYIGFDELVHISESNYLYMFSRLRRLENTNLPLKVRGASNPPDDDQGQWVYHRFVNPKTRNKNTLFIPAGLDDNPFVDRKEYKKTLDVLDPVQRARLKDGVWTIRRKGNMFKRQWCQATNVIPTFRRKVRYWDLAATALTKSQKKRKSEPDYTVGLLLSEHQGIYLIEDIVHTRGTPKEIEDIVKKTAKKDGYSTMIRMEEEPGSSGKNNTDHFARYILKGYDFKGIRADKDKVTRAGAVSSAMERGDIMYLQGCRNIEDFFDEIESFPGGIHDDFVDGLSGAFNSLRRSNNDAIPIISTSDSSYWQDEVLDINDYMKGARG